MTLDDFPLVHYPDLMLVLLKEGLDTPATLDDCIKHVRSNLRRARVREAIGRRELVERLSRALFHLEKAGLVEPCVGETFRTTRRGEQALREHPMGIDDSVLMNYPEFREFIHRSSGPERYRKSTSGEYDQGFEAYLAGKPHTANPYDFDTRAHLSWENGWFEAADEHYLTARE